MELDARAYLADAVSSGRVFRKLSTKSINNCHDIWVEYFGCGLHLRASVSNHFDFSGTEPLVTDAIERVSAGL